LACRLMRLPNVDRVIGLKFPAYYLPHEAKVVWLLHQFRQAYDLWGTSFQGLPDTAMGQRIRSAIMRADNIYLREVDRLYTNSHITADRLMRFNGIPSTVLYPPLLRSDQFSCSQYGDFVYYPSRVNATKRQVLLVDSMKYVCSGVRLVLSGKADTPADAVHLLQRISSSPRADRIQWLDRYIPEERKAELLSSALGCAYIPYDEDSYGYVTLEAFHSRKPVITCTDSGGTDVVVHHGITGFRVEPEPEALAVALDSLYCDVSAAKRMGEAGYELVGSLKISWDHVIRELTR
jgi:glycosyltransferase involved in cell wall biosynthesis